MNDVVHIAGTQAQMDSRYLRQRCAWCGAVLLDYDLDRITVVEGDATPATYHVGELVLVDGAMSMTVDHARGREPLPDNACARLDPAVTV